MKLDRRKFSLVLARLTSPHEGERMAALSIASKMLEEVGLTWETALFGGEDNRKGNRTVGDFAFKKSATSGQPSFYKPHSGMTMKEQMEFVKERYDRLSLSDRMLYTTFRPQVDKGVELSPHNQRLLNEMIHRLKEAEK